MLWWATVFGCIYLVACAPVADDYSIDDAYKTTTELIIKHGYPCEIHKITTADGYILDLYRIPHGKKSARSTLPPRLPILLVHGLFGSSADWVLLGPKKALTFVLSDNNYDVWLLNCRGTRYSTNHTTLAAYGLGTREKYWNFSWHEIGIYDIPATIDYILDKTSSKQLFHVGHSQGVTSFAVMLAERPEYNEKIKAHMAYAPAVFLCHVKNPFLRLLSVPEQFGAYTDLSGLIGNLNLGPRLVFLIQIGSSLCRTGQPLSPFCPYVFSMLFDLSPRKLIAGMIPALLGHYPAGGSSKQLVHYAQCIQSCEFKRYQRSIRKKPAKYNLDNIKVPIYAFYGESDNIQVPQDTLLFRKALTDGFKETFPIKGYGHTDFIFANDAKTCVYDKTISILNDL